MKVTPNEYKTMTETASPNSPIVRTCALAFVIGGLICVLGQFLFDCFTKMKLEELDAKAAAIIVLVFLADVLTALGLYHKLAKFGGAGTLVPITGFANSMSSTSIEFKTEGFIAGVGAKMFTIAGPVIVYGVSASIIYGLICWIVRML